ncbi:MAG: PIN domain-containing protein [Deltaproteobacteria bacterium]|nr:PIN domain-containing protein [Deltaproteobacteria bacterium]
MQKNLRYFNGKEAIFIDSNIFLHHAFDINHVSVEFLNMAELHNLKIYTSSLVLEEVSFKLLMQSASNFLDKVTVPKVKTLLHNEKKREQVLDSVLKYMGYIALLKESGMTVLELKDSDIMTALQKTMEYGLITADAAHYAVMERKGIRHIATGDNDFKSVPGLTLWMPVV